MVKFYRRSASLSALWVSTNDRLSDFYASSWQRGESALPLLVVRLVLSALALGILIWSLFEGRSPYWLIYLTNWGILLVVATLFSGLAVSFSFLCKKRIETTELPWYVSMYWVFFNMGVSVSVMITALYWVLLYNPELRETVGARLFWLDVTTHGFTSCIIMLELLISRTPVRLAHIYQPLGVGLWYVAFTGIYYAVGGTDLLGNRFIYEVLDWQHSKRAGIVVLGSVASLIIVYLMLWGLSYCRDKISISFIRSPSYDMTAPPERTV